MSSTIMLSTLSQPTSDKNSVSTTYNQSTVSNQHSLFNGQNSLLHHFFNANNHISKVGAQKCVAIYVRTISPKHLDHPFLGAAYQIKQLQLACEQKGWQICAVICDYDCDGQQIKRSGLSRIHELALNQEIDAVVCSTPYALGRFTQTSERVRHLLMRSGAEVIFLSDLKSGSKSRSKSSLKPLHPSFNHPLYAPASY